ncbi:MAG: magnesium transporter [Candidatus Aenigmarchaeota archaeon]|nr:magnesium transporter [Candidatus Aenigmarchaeota archaeon]
MQIFAKDFKEIFSTQLISITGGLIAGYFLAVALDKIYLIPGFFILLPGLLDMRGNVSGSLAARLSAGLHLGVIKSRKPINRITVENIKVAILLTLITSLLLGSVAYLANYVFSGVDYPKIILISIFAAVLSNIIEIPMTVFLTFWLFKRGFDPNNIMGPYVTTSGDIVTILSLLAAVAVI